MPVHLRTDSEVWLRSVFDALGAVHDWHAAPSPEMWRVALERLRGTGLFGRGLVSEVCGSEWVPRYACSSADPIEDGSGFLGQPISLASAPIEAEVVRRRSAALVTDVHAEPRVLAGLRRFSRTQAYVVVPVVVCGTVIGLLHMDRDVELRELAIADRDLAKTFADGLSVIHERLLIEAEIARERSAISILMSRPSCAPADGFNKSEQNSPWPAGDSHARAMSTSMRQMFPAKGLGLTSREIEVVELMAGGLSNGEIAAALIVSESTVKSHVKHILRKLHVTNRAAVVARYSRGQLGGLRR